MAVKLWFLVINDDVIGVYDDYETAFEEKGFLEEENRGYEVILKRKDIKDLIEYTVEYELAEERGYI